MSIDRWNWDPNVDMTPSDEGGYVRHSDHERVISEQRAGMQGYVDAFYEIAAMLGMTAQPCSPQQAWAAQMRPYLERLISGQPPLKLVGYTFTDDPAVYAMPGSGFHPGTEPPAEAVNVVAIYETRGNIPQGSREDSMVVLKRDDSGRPTVWCDPGVADLVAALNGGGIETVWSCDGHGYRPAVVGLKDGRQLLVLDSLEALTNISNLWPDINGQWRAP